MADKAYLPNYRVNIINVGVMTGSTGTEIALMEAPVRMRVAKIAVLDTTAIAANDTNYGTGTAYNKGTTGSGTTSVAAQTTKATGGAAVAAHCAWELTLSTTLANLIIEAGEALSFKWTEAGSGQDLVAAQVQVEWIPHAGMAT